MIRRTILLLGMLLIMAQGGFPQQHPAVRAQTNVQQLQTLSQLYNTQYQQAFQQARAVALQYGLPVRAVLSNNRVISLQRLSPSGIPLYYTTFNLDAAKTVSTNDVWPTDQPAGTGLFDLSGENMIIGEWDGGAVLKTHQEFMAPNNTSRVTQVDGYSTLSAHSTHVAGTLIAYGVDPNAHGMSHLAQLHAWQYDNDQAEMAPAAAGGLFLSNHSYGYVTGWTYDFFGMQRWTWFGDPAVSDSVDYYFGFYDSAAHDWDAITHNAPYYLPVVAAGNDRTDVGPSPGDLYYFFNSSGQKDSSTTYPPAAGPDGPYDTISHFSLAKNVLSVGAIRPIPTGFTSPSDAIMTSFSSWGPTDDGRVKPDLVGDGYDVFSSIDTSITAYARFDGTSMATPNVTGSLNLLEELYMNLYGGTPMRAATLKGLAIETADDAGPAGPDYQFGWGVLNTRTAAEFVADSVNKTIEEGTLLDGLVHTVQVVVPAQQDLNATLSWTDPPGTVPTASLTPTGKALVNDLDMIITRQSDGTTYNPWILDPANPSNPATKGDNVVDNVEQVFVTSAQPDTYLVTITNKPSLQGGQQDFSLLVNAGAQPNSPPTVASAIPPVTLLEDFGSVTVADLDTVFQDPDDSNLQYTVTAGSGISATVNGSLLEFQSVEDANGQTTVIAYASDGYSTTPDTVRVTVTPVNDAPGPFALLNPADHYFNASQPNMQFTWGTSIDKEQQPIRYRVQISDSAGFAADTVVAGTNFNLNVVQGEMPRNTAIYWNVAAMDESSATMSSNGPHVFLVSPTVELAGYAGGEPTEYTLFQSFPNPFGGNRTTTSIGYGLIDQVEVTLTIYDTRGRAVKTLVEHQSQGKGWHKVAWDGTDTRGQPVSSGIYLYQLIAGDFRAHKRLVLVR